MTEYLRPRSLDEALAARAAHPEFMVLAGATDLMVDAKHKRASADRHHRRVAHARSGSESPRPATAVAIRAGTTWPRGPAPSGDPRALGAARAGRARDRRTADPGARDAGRQRRHVVAGR